MNTILHLLFLCVLRSEILPHYNTENTSYKDHRKYMDYQEREDNDFQKFDFTYILV